MDPNETLRTIRETADVLVKAIEEVKDTDAGTALGMARRLASHVWALDSWLSKGGFLPEAWHYEGPGPVTTEYRVADPLGGPVPGLHGAHLPDDDEIRATVARLSTPRKGND